MRIISGKYRGRKLSDSSKLRSLRPTTDSNRENIFNIFASSKKLEEISFKLEQSEVLDVFCGTGSISFEAISRGAKRATLIDNNRDHLELAKSNANLLAITNIKFIQIDILKPIPKNYDENYNLIYIDPPYSQNMAQKSLENLNQSGWIKNNALITIERSSDEKISFSEQEFKIIDQRRYGRTIFDFLLKK